MDNNKQTCNNHGVLGPEQIRKINEQDEAKVKLGKRPVHTKRK